MVKDEEIALTTGHQTISRDLPTVSKEDGKPTKLILINSKLNIHWFVVDESGQTIASTNPQVQAELELKESGHPQFQEAKEMLPKFIKPQVPFLKCGFVNVDSLLQN